MSKNLKIVYIILAHKLPKQLVRLVKKLNTPDITFYIHVDKKTKIQVFNEMANPLKEMNNVHFLDRTRCTWGGFGHVQATLTGIRELFTNQINFDYLFLLTGQDYPIKNNEYIQERLQSSHNKSFIDFSPIPDPNARNWEDSFIYWHFHWGGRHIAFPKKNSIYAPVFKELWNFLVDKITARRKFPIGFSPFHGLAYWSLSYDCVEYIHHFFIKNIEYLKFFHHVQIPDEIIFHSVLLNSPYKNKLVNNDLRYIHFPKNSYHPEILKTNDFDKLMQSSDLFARKFDVNVDGKILDIIDEKILKGK